MRFDRRYLPPPMPQTGICLLRRPEIPAGILLFRFSGKRLGLGHPGIGAGRQTDFFADLVGGVVVEFGELPVVEDAEVVELLLDGAGHAGELLEVVRRATWAGEALEAGSLRRGRNFFAYRLRGGADIDAGIALCPRNAV